MRDGAAPPHPRIYRVPPPPGVYIQQKYIEAYGFGVDSIVVLNTLVTTRVFNVHLVLEYT